MSEPNVEPFPWNSLESLHRSELVSQRALRTKAAPFLDLRRLGAAARALFGFELAARFRRISARAAGRTTDAVFVFGASGEEETLLLELEAAAAHRLLAAALGQRDPLITHDVALSPNESGALAAALLSGVRATGAHTPPKLFAAGQGTLAHTWREQHSGSVCALFTLILGDEAYDARVSFLPGSPAARAPQFKNVTLRTLGATPLGLHVVLASALLSRADLQDLAPGDAWIPGAITHTATTPVLFCSPQSETALSGVLDKNGALTFHGKQVELPWSIVVEDPSMKDDNVAAALENAPVVVRVEIGTCELSAREWSELEPGDVVSLKQRVGDPVTLRAGGVDIARGELVQIDGEVGVRILSRQSS